MCTANDLQTCQATYTSCPLLSHYHRSTRFPAKSRGHGPHFKLGGDKLRKESRVVIIWSSDSSEFPWCNLHVFIHFGSILLPLTQKLINPDFVSYRYCLHEDSVLFVIDSTVSLWFSWGRVILFLYPWKIGSNKTSQERKEKLIKFYKEQTNSLLYIIDSHPKKWKHKVRGSLLIGFFMVGLR